MIRRYAPALVLALAASSSTMLFAQGSQSADEQAIREAIARYDKGERNTIMASDRVFWSDATRRPTVGSEQGEESPNIRVPLATRVPNSQRNKTMPAHIEVAKSGDLAYEYSNGELSVDTKDSRHLVMPQGILRVWRKEAGQWKIAAMFTRVIEDAGTPPRSQGK